MSSDGGPPAGPPGDFYASQTHEPFNYQYSEAQLQAQVHAQSASPYVVADSSGRLPYFETQIRALEYRPASSTVSAGASAASAVATPNPRMAQKRPSEDDGASNGSPSKQIRCEHPEQFSRAVQKKLKDSNRTGQACDRCKVSLKGLRRSIQTEAYNSYNCRYERSDATHASRDVDHASRIRQNASLQTELQARPQGEDILKHSNDRTKTRRTAFGSWNVKY